MSLFYTPEAIDDLKRLKAFIGSKNPSAAQQASSELRKGISILKTIPYAGRKVMKAQNPEIIRDLSVNKYIVRYLVLDDDIHILRIWHKLENWSNA